MRHDKWANTQHQKGNKIAHTRVPDLEAHNSVGVIVDHALCQEAGANGRRYLSRVEGALAVPHDKGRLAHVLGTQDHDLGLERGRHGLCRGPHRRCSVARTLSRSREGAADGGGGGGGLVGRRGCGETRKTDDGTETRKATLDEARRNDDGESRNCCWTRGWVEEGSLWHCRSRQRTRRRCRPRVEGTMRWHRWKTKWHGERKG